jgi:hypothetical protein
MRSEVTVRFAPDDEFDIPLAADEQPLPADAARRWLDEQFLANDCEPLRASGKVLTADKLLAIAAAVGPRRFESDAAFRHGYARAASAALGKPIVRIDVDARSIDF